MCACTRYEEALGAGGIGGGGEETLRDLVKDMRENIVHVRTSKR